MFFGIYGKQKGISIPNLQITSRVPGRTIPNACELFGCCGQEWGEITSNHSIFKIIELFQESTRIQPVTRERRERTSFNLVPSMI